MGIVLLCKNQYYGGLLLAAVVIACILALGLLMNFLGSRLTSVCVESGISRELYHKIDLSSLLH